MLRSTGSRIGAVAFAVAVGAVVFGGENNECRLDADGRIHYNDAVLSDQMQMGEGEIGDTVGIFDSASNSGNPVLTCVLGE